MAHHEDIDGAGRFLFERGIYVTLAAFPLVPKNEFGMRVQVTAANTDEEVAQLITVRGELRKRYPLCESDPTVQAAQESLANAS